MLGKIFLSQTVGMYMVTEKRLLERVIFEVICKLLDYFFTDSGMRTYIKIEYLKKNLQKN